MTLNQNIYIYPKLLEEVDMEKKKKKRVRKIKKGYRTSHLKKLIWKKNT